MLVEMKNKEEGLQCKTTIIIGRVNDFTNQFFSKMNRSFIDAYISIRKIFILHKYPRKFFHEKRNQESIS